LDPRSEARRLTERVIREDKRVRLLSRNGSNWTQCQSACRFDLGADHAWQLSAAVSNGAPMATAVFSISAATGGGAFDLLQRKPQFSSALLAIPFSEFNLSPLELN
jgi:hypothetical protein